MFDDEYNDEMNQNSYIKLNNYVIEKQKKEIFF